ncbi:HtaA domain-containing protein [Arcanobacterium haemolyticum]|nr:HtaA domain-containing protein [Arcanobacterium haemolyticum]
MSSRLKERLVAGVAAFSLILGGVSVASVATAAEAAPTTTIDTGAMTWGVKESFRSYLTNAGGTIQTIDGASTTESGLYAFPVVSGQSRGETTKFTGGVHFLAHGGMLDVTISNPTISGKGVERTLKADVSSRPMGGTEAKNYGTIDFAKVTFNQPKISGNNYSLDTSSVALTAQGAEAFAGFYKEGTALDNLTIAFTTKTETPAPEPSAEPSQEPSEAPSTQPSTEPTTPTEPENPSTPAPASNALTWGIFKRFVDYVAGAGTVEGLDGASFDVATKLFTFPVTEGQDITANSTRIAFDGAAHLSAHGGMLDLTLSKPVIQKNAEGQWVLTATANGQEVTFATLEGVSIAEADGLATISVEKALIADGAFQFFGGRARPGYNVGDELSAPTAVVSLSSPQTPTEPETPAAPEPVEATNSLVWGVKTSFVNYILGPIAQGVAEPIAPASFDSATRTFAFALAPGQDLTQDFTKVSFLGGAHFVGHSGALDLTVSNPVIEKIPADPMNRAVASETWVLKATVASKSLSSGEVVDYGEVTVATLHDAAFSVKDNVVTLTAQTVTFNGDAEAAFAGFYKAGDELAPVTAEFSALPVEKPATPETPTDPQTPADPNTPDTTPAAPNEAAAPAADTPAAPVKECKVDENQMRVTSGSLSWGIKQSFTTYIRSSIANGDWELAGASWNNGAFTFSASGGLFNTASKSGTVYYSGSVHFTGHDGKLDLTIANPALVINGKSGSLYATVSSSDMNGAKTNYGRVNFATVSFSSLSASAGTLNFSTSSVTLTPAGAQAFAGFYSAGESLDNLSGRASLVVNSECDPVTGELKVYDAFGKLAYTGSESANLALAALALLALGGAGVLARRRVS